MSQLLGGRVLNPTRPPRPRPCCPPPGPPAARSSRARVSGAADVGASAHARKAASGRLPAPAPPPLTCRAACARACAGARDSAASGSGSLTPRGCTLNPGVGGGRGGGEESWPGGDRRGRPASGRMISSADLSLGNLRMLLSFQS